ncbi:MAG: hypothetical protein ACOCZ6_03885 [Nanoarchaeota archaeon]
MLRRERPEPEGRASHRSVTDGGRGLLTVFARSKLKQELMADYEKIKDYALEGTKADELLENYEYERK